MGFQIDHIKSCPSLKEMHMKIENAILVNIKAETVEMLKSVDGNLKVTKYPRAHININNNLFSYEISCKLCLLLMYF